MFRLAKLATKNTAAITIIPIGIAYSNLSPKFRAQFCLSFGQPIFMNNSLNFTIEEFNNLLYERMLKEEKIALKNIDR